MRFVGALIGIVLGLIAGLGVLFIVASSVSTGDYGQMSRGGSAAASMGLAAVPAAAVLGAFLGWKAASKRVP